MCLMVSWRLSARLEWSLAATVAFCLHKSFSPRIRSNAPLDGRFGRTLIQHYGQRSDWQQWVQINKACKLAFAHVACTSFSITWEAVGRRLLPVRCRWCKPYYPMPRLREKRWSLLGTALRESGSPMVVEPHTLPFCVKTVTFARLQAELGYKVRRIDCFVVFPGVMGRQCQATAT